VPTATPIERAHAEPQLAVARALMTEYLAWVIDATRAAGLDPETLRAHYYEGGADTLPGAFVPPDGCLLLALPAQGIVGYDRASGAACEMKRLYVPPTGRGQGIARALVSRLLDEARSAGYRSMRLETRAFMQDAIALYGSLGFRACDAFHPIPESFRAATRFMERDL
jgi:ribosomal protein S18 acetylase RimI-like enzyme